MLKRYFLFLLTIASLIIVSQPEILMKRNAIDEGNSNSPDKILNQNQKGMYLFPQVTRSRVTPKTDNVQPQMTTKLLELWAKPEEAAETEAEAREAPGGASTDDDGGSATEMTISVPRFSKDEKGDWVYHYYAATYGKVWRDTRFNINGIYTVQRYRVDSAAVYKYYPRGPPVTVCMGRSTVYNRPIVLNYLDRSLISNRAMRHRPIWTTLRRQIFKHATSEECHDEKKYNSWHKFQNCQIRRHQRMEYMIPKYPLHQRKDMYK